MAELSSLLRAVFEHAAYSVLWTVGVLLAALAPLLSVSGLLFMLIWLMGKIVDWGLGWNGVRLLAIVGTPVHEISHATAGLLFGRRPRRITLYAPNSASGILGQTDFDPPNERNPLTWFGELAILIAPLLGGAVALLLLTYLLVPGFDPLAGQPQLDTLNGLTAGRDLDGLVSSFWQWLGYELQLTADLIDSIDWSQWTSFVFAFAVFSIAFRMTPSSSDIALTGTALSKSILLLAGFLSFGYLLYADGIAWIVSMVAQPVAILTAIMNFALAVGIVVTLLAFLITLPFALLRG